MHAEKTSSFNNVKEHPFGKYDTHNIYIVIITQSLIIIYTKENWTLLKSQMVDGLRWPTAIWQT